MLKNILAHTINHKAKLGGIVCRSLNIKSSYLQFDQFGSPEEVVKRHEEILNSPSAKQVLVKILLSPINPADINVIQGKYGEVPKLPFVPGNECVAEVVECGEGVKNVKPGDRIIPFASLLGTWRTHALFNENDIFKVPASISNVDAATITVNPSTAFRMLRDFVHLKAGDVVIQNGANSAVGQSVIQLCRIWNLKSVNVVRNRANIEELKNTLKGLGATEVFTEEEIRVTPIFKSGELSAPKIGLNCVGGKSATNILRYLAPHGQLITYGAMSRESLTIPNAALIFKDIAFRGYWMSRWFKESSDTERKQMYEELFQLMSSGEFKPAIHKLISLDEYKEALARLADVKGMTGHKYLFSFNQ